MACDPSHSTAESSIKLRLIVPYMMLRCWQSWKPSRFSAAMPMGILYVFSQTIIAYTSLRLNPNSTSVRFGGWKYQNYKIEYKSGAKNHLADALSRRADHIPESECVVIAVTTAAVESDFLQGVIEAFSHDPLYSQEDAEHPSRTVLESDGTWWMTDSTQQKRLCIPDNQEI